MTLVHRFSVFLLAVMLASLLGCGSSPKHEKTGEYIDDAVISAKVAADLIEEPSLRSFDIKVVTFKGMVQLSGFVRSQSDVEKAGEIARRVKGVRSVKNDILLM